MSAPAFNGQPTICTKAPGHTHSSTAGVPEVNPGVTVSTAYHPVSTSEAATGRLVRRVGWIRYDTATGRMHITPCTGATSVEAEALIETAAHPRDDYGPERWPAHPCDPGSRMIALYRYVDDGYADEAAAEAVINLGDEYVAVTITAWAESVVTA